VSPIGPSIELEGLRRTVAGLALAALPALLLGYVLAVYGPAPAVALLALPLIALALVAWPVEAFAGAVLIAIVVPFHLEVVSPQAAGFRIAAAVALAAIAVAAAKGMVSVRLNVVDLAVAAIVLASVVSWLILGGGGRTTLNPLLPLAFYVGARLIPARRMESMLWVLTIAGAVASFSLFYEFLVTKAPLFVPPESYLWNETGASLFRPGGVFSSPPGAVTVLSITVLCGLPLAARHTGRLRLLAVLCMALGTAAALLTFTRAGFIGLGAGLCVYVLVAGSRVVTLRRLVIGGAVVSVLFAAVVLPALTGSTWFQEGIVRPGNLTARQSYWHLAGPLITDSTQHLVFGHGVNSLVEGSPEVGGTIDAGLGTTPTLTEIGPHSQYVRMLLEQGVLGLVLLAAWLIGAPALALARLKAVPPAARPLAGALAGATLSFIIVSFANDSMRHPPSVAAIAIVTGMLATIGGTAAAGSLGTRDGGR
jgi:O-antigen ligase